VTGATHYLGLQSDVFFPCLFLTIDPTSGSGSAIYGFTALQRPNGLPPSQAFICFAACKINNPDEKPFKQLDFIFSIAQEMRFFLRVLKKSKKLLI
jgi:hypothetical protein